MTSSTVSMLTKLVLSALLLLANAALRAHSFQIYFNMNQASPVLLTRPNEWKRLYGQLNGLFGPAAPNPETPMTLEQNSKFINLFNNRQRVLIVPYLDWAKKPMPRGQFVKEHPIYADFNGNDVYTWGEQGALLNINQLDKLKSAQFGPVLVNVRGWRFGEGALKVDNPDGVKQALSHPMVKGVVIEATAFALSYPKPSINSRVQVAKWVLGKGKPVYFLLPPPPGSAAGLVDKTQKMLDTLFIGLGKGVMCSNRVILVPAAYNVKMNSVPFLPETLANGSPANTVTGAALKMAMYRNSKC